MQKDQQAKGNLSSSVKPTDAKKVKKEIQSDIKEGQGAMSSREAGAMRE